MIFGGKANTAANRRLRTLLSVGVSLVVVMALLGSLNEPATAETPADHGLLAPEKPRADTPVILDGHANATVKFGNLIVVAGLFTQVELPNGTVVEQKNLIAYNIETGKLAKWFNPKINGEVLALESADDGSGLFLGGKFSKVDGIARFKIAKLDNSGEVDTTFVANANAKVQTLDDDGKRLYLGGNFTQVNAVNRLGLAAVNITTGAVSSFRNDVTDPVGLGGSGAVRSVDVHPSGDILLIAHTSRFIDGKPRTGIAQIDLTTDEVSDWHSDWYEASFRRCKDNGALTIREAEYAPDGDTFFVVEKGDFNCAKVVAFPTADAAGLEQNLWVTAMFDSTFSLGVSDFAVYLGGHFCFVNPLGPISSNAAPTIDYVDKPVPCIATGNRDNAAALARNKMAALDPNTGAVLDWNPKTTAFSGIFDIEVIDRGLLLTQDQDSIGEVITGRHSFIEVPPNPNPTPKPDPTPSPDPTPTPDPTPSVDDEGYYLLDADGGVFTFGDVDDLGNVKLTEQTTAVALSATSSGKGYLVVGSDWTVYSFGDAPTTEPDLTKVSEYDVPVDIAIDPQGRGYWIFSANGGVIAVGDVPHYGDANNIKLNEAIVAASLTAAGDGYRLLGADGGVFTFGNAPFFGSIPQVLPGRTLDCPIVGIVDSDNTGYWLVACDGGVFAFGDAPFVGSLPQLGVAPNEPVNGMVTYVDGYLLIAEDGGVFAFGGPFQGSLGDLTLNAPITGITAR